MRELFATAAIVLGLVATVFPAAAAPPPNDDFDAAQVIVGSEGNADGFNTDATAEPSEATDVCGKSVWYSWTAPDSTPTTFDIPAAAGCPTLAIYQGDALDMLTPIASWQPYSPPGSGYIGGPISFRPEVGAKYQIKVNSADQCVPSCADGSFALSWAPALGPPNDFFIDAIVIAGLEGAIEADRPFVVTATYEGEPAVTEGGDYVTRRHSLWYRWTAPSDVCMVFEALRVSGLYTTVAVFTGSSAAALELVAADAFGGIQSGGSGGSRLAFPAIAGTAYYIMLDGSLVSQGGEGDAGLTWINAGAGPANDNFANAETVAGLAGSIAGASGGATIECGEQTIPGESVIGGVISATVWYRWISPFTGRVAFATDGSTFDSGLAVYTGDTVDELELLGSDDDSGEMGNPSGVGPSKVVFDAVAGTTYRISVGGFNDEQGALMLNWAPVPANDDFANEELISGPTGTVSGNNLAASREVGEPSHANSSLISRSIWYAWTAPTSQRITFSPVGENFGGPYFTVLAVYVGDALDALTPISSVNGGASGITFDAVAETEYSIALDGWSATGATLLRWQAPPANDNFVDAQQIAGFSGAIIQSNIGASLEEGEPNPGAEVRDASLWYRWQAPGDGLATVDATGSSFNPQVIVSVYIGESLSSLSMVTTKYLPATANFGVTAGVEYYIQVASINVQVASQAHSQWGDVDLRWSTCGDGAVDTGEQCDLGEVNGAAGACCSAACTFVSAGTPCRATAGPCDQAETCTGSTATCPADVFSSSSTTCRPSNGVCDAAERCTGSTGSCPTDVFASSTTVCRTSAGECDLPENCGGSAETCPADAFVANNTGCTSDGNACTSDICNGSSATCTHPNNTAPCNDNVFCNGADICSGGTCNVHAGNPCAGPDGDANCAESCDETADGCTAKDPDGSACNDADGCTSDDSCTDGACSGTPAPECTTTTTLVPKLVCGDANGDGTVTASDALAALRAAVGAGTCSLEACDFNGDGELTAADALAILRVAVGQAVNPSCPSAAASVAPAVSTTTVPSPSTSTSTTQP